MFVKPLFAVLLTTLVLLTACQNNEPTHSVEWFAEHKQERDTTLSACRENPSVLQNTPNCVNAHRAQNQITWGTKGRGIVLDKEKRP